MRLVSAGHAVFAAVLIALGIQGLVHGDFTAVWQPVPKGVPAREVLIYLCASISLASGIGLLWRRTAALAAGVLLGSLVLWFLLWRVRFLFLAPLIEGTWSCGATMVMTAGAWALFAAFARQRQRLGFATGGVRDPLTREYHLYLTNIPPNKLSPDDIAQVYAARWIIELLFRELKSRYHAEDMPSSKRHVVEALVYAVLITFVVSRALLAELRRKLGALGARVPEERWATLFAAAVLDILRVVLWRPALAAALAASLDANLLHEAVDPNAGRALLLRRVESRSQFRHRVSVGEGHA